MMKLIDWDAIDRRRRRFERRRCRRGGGPGEARTTRSWFCRTKPKAKARPTGAPRPAAAEKPKTTAEIHAARILGRA
jgi:hypothetical protein